MIQVRQYITRLSKKYITRQQRKRAIPFVASFLIALLSALLLFKSVVLGNLNSFIISIGLDPQRAQFMAALIVTLIAASIGGIVGRRRWMAMMGSALIFCFAYLFPFISLQSQPTYDPGGHLEILNAGALIHTSLVMAALALLSAFIGAVVGIALSETLLNPFYQLAQLLWHRIGRQLNHDQNQNQDAREGVILSAAKDLSPQGHRPFAALRMTGEAQDDSLGRPAQFKTPPNERRDLSSSRSQSSWLLWTGAIVMIMLLILASGASDIFLYTPDTGLHAPPKISNIQGAQPVHSTILDDSLVSPAMNGQRRIFKVYLPPSYNTAQGRAKRYPTLYLLHGSPGSDIDWLRAGQSNQSTDTLIATGQIPELIIIAPDGNGRGGLPTEWGNSFDGKQRIETFVAVDLVNYVDSYYRTIPNAADRAIGGNSMGGFGAMNIALHHPGVFGLVISLGGYYKAEGGIWGNNVGYMRTNSPADIIATDKPAWNIHMFIGAATRDQPYYSDSLNYVKQLSKLSIQYHLDIQKGYHSWKIWQIQMYNALLWLKWA